MKRLISEFNCDVTVAVGLYIWSVNPNEKIAILGKYDGSTFEGGDRLSMAVMSDNELFLQNCKAEIVIAEGDRFTNKTFMERFDPFVLKINGDGKVGRNMRGTSQSDQHIKSIQTRVNNFQADQEFGNSAECLYFIKEYLNGNQPLIKVTRAKQQSIDDFLNF